MQTRVSRPRVAFVVKKLHDADAAVAFRTACGILQRLNVSVVAEASSVDEFPSMGLIVFDPRRPQGIDFIVTLGGDGTVLHANSLFADAVPHVVPFHCGSLGFLTPFDVESMSEVLSTFVQRGMNMTVRMRLSCRLERASVSEGGMRVNVLNELVIDRGASPYLTQIDCYCNSVFFTTAQADGLIVSSPTGSTGYSLSAGGSMVHPDVRGILLTPICPHSLSFRPLVLPDSVELRLTVPPTARATAWASFDGRMRQELRAGDSIVVTTSPHPIICATESGNGQAQWLDQLGSRLNWNQRAKQKALQPSDVGASGALSLSMTTATTATAATTSVAARAHASPPPGASAPVPAVLAPLSDPALERLSPAL